MLKTVSELPRIAKNVVYGFTYLWCIFRSWLERDHLWTRNGDTVIVFLLFIYLSYYKDFLGDTLEDFTFGRVVCYEMQFYLTEIFSAFREDLCTFYTFFLWRKLFPVEALIIRLCFYCKQA